jgi:type II secretory pathway pseudopilin PulG
MIGILAAAVVPAVVGQLQKGDVGRLGDDALAIRGAVEQFSADVRKLPASIGQLTSPITASMADFVAGPAANTSFTSTDVTHWKGPYLSKDSAAAIVTAYGLNFNTAFTLDTLSPIADHITTGQRYLVLVIPLVDTTTVRLLDNLYDDGVTTTGFIRDSAFTTGANAGKAVLKILLTPVQ